MAVIDNLEHGVKKLYDDNFFSGDYNQEMYIMKSVDDGSHKDKYYLEVYSNINGVYTMQGYIYFYLNVKDNSCSFIGMRVVEEYRNLNIGSLLVSAWIDFCLNNGYEFIGVHPKQKKPFLLYMLKTYAFDVFDKNMYKTRNDVISICRGIDIDDNNKYLMFKNERHQRNFMQTNIYKSDNYKIIDDLDEAIEIDKIIFPLQDVTRHPADYYLQDKDYAGYRSSKILTRHRK